MMQQRALEMLPEDWAGLLAVVAHPDDMEYGAASAVARWTSQGKRAAYLLVTRGEAGIDGKPPEMTGPLREAEERQSAREVGVGDVEFLDYADGVIEYGLPLRRDISRAIRRHRPEALVTVNHGLTFPGARLNMADHRWVGLAALDAARDAGNRWIFPGMLEEGLEPWDGVRMVLVAGSANPTHAVDVSGSIGRGVASLARHEAYISNLPESFDPGEFLRGMAAETGKHVGCEYAVAFEVIWIQAPQKRSGQR